jgi:nucleotide-binding universal stress UspA family protein
MVVYKDLLVAINPARNREARLEVAVRMARTFNAHLTGLHAAPSPYVLPFVDPPIAPEALELQAGFLRQAREKAKALFQARVAAEGLSAEWREQDGDAGTITSLHARYADLAILGQADPGAVAGEEAHDIVGSVVLGSGRPVLVVPYAGTFPSLGERVLVAWNASREAARAVNDALPILQRAAQVVVLAVNPHGGPRGHGEAPGADIALHLARHGVKAEADWFKAEDLAVGEALLSRAADLSVDLVVMGAYGRTRVRELILGGATRAMLQAMTTPVLMSH